MPDPGEWLPACLPAWRRDSDGHSAGGEVGGQHACTGLCMDRCSAGPRTPRAPTTCHSRTPHSRIHTAINSHPLTHSTHSYHPCAAGLVHAAARGGKAVVRAGPAAGCVWGAVGGWAGAWAGGWVGGRTEAASGAAHRRAGGEGCMHALACRHSTPPSHPPMRNPPCAELPLHDVMCELLDLLQPKDPPRVTLAGEEAGGGASAGQGGGPRGEGVQGSTDTLQASPCTTVSHPPLPLPPARPPQIWSAAARGRRWWGCWLMWGLIGSTRIGRRLCSSSTSSTPRRGRRSDAGVGVARGACVARGMQRVACSARAALETHTLYRPLKHTHFTDP